MRPTDATRQFRLSRTPPPPRSENFDPEPGWLDSPHGSTGTRRTNGRLGPLLGPKLGQTYGPRRETARCLANCPATTIQETSPTNERPSPGPAAWPIRVLPNERNRPTGMPNRPTAKRSTRHQSCSDHPTSAKLLPPQPPSHPAGQHNACPNRSPAASKPPETPEIVTACLTGTAARSVASVRLIRFILAIRPIRTSR